MTNETKIHEIPEWNRDRLTREINKLNKRAAKIGANPIEVVDHGIKLVIHPNSRELVTRGKVSREDAPKVRIHQIELVGEPPKLEGYEFVGTLDHITLPGKVIVKTVPGRSVPKEFYDHDATCDHCKKIRRRNETFILHHVEDDKYEQVGRNCIRDFLGHDPNGIARFLSSLWTLIDSFDDDDEESGWFSGGGRRDYYYPHQKILKTTSAMIRTYGWVPRSSANPDEGRIATADLVLRVMLPAFDKYSKEEQQSLIDNMKWDDEKDTADADEAVAWLMKQDADNEYLHNLQTISEADAVPSRMFGFWCSLVAAYHRHQDRLNLNKATQKTNEWVGVIKERRDFKIKVVGLRYISGYYGTVTLHKMLDEKGRTLIWFANTDSGMEEGNTYIIKGTVKEHDEYKDWKQTVLSRVKVVEEVEEDD